MKKNKKYGLAALAATIGISILILFLSGTDQISLQPESKLIQIPTSNFPAATYDRTYGTINASFGSSVLGSPDAPVTIIAFGDYQCSGCKDWSKNILPEIEEKLIETEKANLVFIDAKPVGKDSLKAAEAAYCAGKQGKYWEYNRFLFENQQEVDNGWANVDSLKGYANNLGLDMDSFVSCLDSGKYEKKVKFNSFESTKNGITKIPAFIILDSEGRHHIIKGSASYPVFEKIIESFIEKLENE